MATLEQLLAIARNTFFESIRQPVLLVVLVICTILVVLSNPFSAYTMTDDNKMFVDIGLSTVFIGGAILSAFIASNVITREIENRTVLTVVSKPVSRPVFIFGKYVGVCGAQVLAMLFLSFVFMLVDIHGVQQTVTTPYHLPVILLGFAAVVVGAVAGIWCNFFYGWVFSSTFVVLTTPLLAIAYVLCLIFAHDFATQSPAVSFEGNLWIAVLAVILAQLVLSAIAVAVSTRFSQITTLITTVGFFLLGLLSDWIFARRINALGETFESLGQTTTAPFDGLHVQFWFFQTLHAIVPNFQVFWLADAITQDANIPLDYLAWTLPYGLLMIVIALAIAIILFQRREVG
jgi:ABC-type transport system involved in multi-copper enzyme maturation permease subunit